MQPNDLVISKSNKQPYVVIKMEKKVGRFQNGSPKAIS